MKAVILSAFGGVEQLELKEVPEPRVGPESIKVRVAATSINPVDGKIRRGGYTRVAIHLPMILGRDAAGVVVEVGRDVTTFEVGQTVMGLVGSAWADVVAAPVNAWARVPIGMDVTDAAAYPLVLLTGSQLIDEAVKPKAGETVLITGALGSVGRAAVFTAKARGARVWAGVRASQKGEAQALGVEGVVAIDDDADIATLPVLDTLADTVGGEPLQKLMARVKPGGTVGSVLGEPAGARDKGLVSHAIMGHPDAKRLADLAAAIVEGRLVIPIAKKLPLADVRAAQSAAEKGGAGGKIVMVV